MVGNISATIHRQILFLQMWFLRVTRTVTFVRARLSRAVTGAKSERSHSLHRQLSRFEEFGSNFSATAYVK